MQHRSHFILLLICALSISSCTKKAYYSIDTRTDIREGNYVIRWQVNPGMKGDVEIYASNDAVNYPVKPFAVESIGKEVATYQYQTDDGMYAQQFFLLVFAGREMRVVAHREVPTIGVTNLRDFGGYMTTDGEQVKWGQLYRSGTLAEITPHDSAVIESVGVSHQLLLLDTLSSKSGKSRIPSVEEIALQPDVETNTEFLRQQIYDLQMDAKGVQGLFGQLFSNYAYENVNQFSTALHYMLDPAHYPILLTDEWGKDRTAFLVMLVQSALNMSRADILSDFLLSNQLLLVEQLEPHGFAYPPVVQEAITEFYRSRANDLHAIMYDIENRYGSISAYMDKVLHFSPREQAQLRKLLLY